MLMDAKVDKFMQAMQAFSQVMEKHDLPSGFTPTTNFIHGPNGIFNTPGIERDVFASRVMPKGMLAVLPSRGVIDTNPITAYLSGFTAESGTEPSTECADCVEAGEVKSCRQVTQFGEICRDTAPLNMSKIGRRVNSGETSDLMLVNDPGLSNAPMWVPPGIPKDLQAILTSEVWSRWITLGVAFEEKMANLLWTGNAANSNAAGYAEYEGFERLVNTGHSDVVTGIACPSIDSLVHNMNYTTVENGAAEIFNYLTAAVRYVKHNADRMAFNPVQWVFVMKENLFRMLADRWPCVFASYGCNATANDVSNNVDGLRQKAMQDEMFNGRFLEIDGTRFPVVVDDAIPYESNIDNGNLPSGTFASDIYFLPLTVRGGRIVTFMEYFDYARGVMPGVAQGRLTNEYWSDGGRWLWTFNRTSWCVKWKSKIEPRLRLLTPQLAFRMQNIQYTPLINFREPFHAQPGVPGSENSYFIDGGATEGSGLIYTYSDNFV
jgi:hypothetical protein